MTYGNYYNNGNCGCPGGKYAGRNGGYGRNEGYAPNGVFDWIGGGIYDDRCCILVKIAYTFFTEKTQCIIHEAFRYLESLVARGCINRHEFQIRYGLYRIAIQELNREIVCALRKVLKEDHCGTGECGSSFLGNEFCFDNDFCEESVAAIITIGLTKLRELLDLRDRAFLNRTSEECTIRLILEQLRDGLVLVTAKCHPRRGLDFNRRKLCCPDLSASTVSVSGCHPCRKRRGFNGGNSKLH